jgi:hypothetical protein
MISLVNHEGEPTCAKQSVQDILPWNCPRCRKLYLAIIKALHPLHVQESLKVRRALEPRLFSMSKVNATPDAVTPFAMPKNQVHSYFLSFTKRTFDLSGSKTRLNGLLALQRRIELSDHLVHPFQRPLVGTLALLPNQHDQLARLGLILSMTKVLLNTRTELIRTATDFLRIVCTQDRTSSLSRVCRPRNYGLRIWVMRTQGREGVKEFLLRVSESAKHTNETRMYLPKSSRAASSPPG